LTLHEIAEIIGAAASDASFDRGLNYWRRGHVLLVEPAPNGRSFTAEVRGSSGRRYAQHVSVSYGRQGRVTNMSGTCSCPVGRNCKHVVAASLAWSQAEKTATPSPQTSQHSPLSSDVKIWLKSLENPPSPKAMSTQEPNRLYYVFDNTAERKAQITMWKARRTKSGKMGKNAAPYDRYGGHTVHQDMADAGITSILDHLRIGYGHSAAYEWPSGDEMLTLLRAIIDTGRARAFSLDTPALQWTDPRAVRLEWQVAESGMQRMRCVDAEGIALNTFAFDPPLWVDPQTGACGLLETDLPDDLAARFLSAPDIPATEAEAVVKSLTKVGITHAPLPKIVRSEVRKDITPTPILRLSAPAAQFPQTYGFMYSNKDRFVTEPLPIMRPEFDYDGVCASVVDQQDISSYQDGNVTLIQRDKNAERAAIKSFYTICGSDNWSLEEAVQDGLVLVDNPHPDERTFLPLDEPYDDQELAAIILDFSAHEIPALEQAGWTIEYADSWSYRLYEGETIFSAGLESSGTDWFSFALTVEADGESIDLLPIVLKIVDTIPLDAYEDESFHLEDFLSSLAVYPQLSDGRRVAISGERLAPIVRALIETYGVHGFHRGDAARIADLAEAMDGCGIPWQGGEELLALGQKLRALHDQTDIAPPPSLNAELRPYQSTGFGWLSALSQTGFGGVLADDMGLGKTVQALALLAQRHLEDTSERPSLVVVPTSLIGNWQREAAKFTPALKLLTLHGPERKKHFDKIQDHHVTLTTYPLVHRDHEALFSHKWDTVILDEAQAIKNPKSSIAKRIRDIEANHRLALTGTPMENSLIELWALFDWLVPGLLGSRPNFVKNFRTPIEKHGDSERQKYLSARVSPFLLRRTKEVVAADLPAKTEINEIIPLEGPQRDLYETLRIAMSKRVRDAIKQKGVGASHITILDALLKLRQACCDPKLIKLKAAEKVEGSAKRARLMELLDELVAEGRKVLIFSQFVEMLKLIEADITARGWGYAMLTGRTKKRAEQIEKFQDGDAPIFLISLKAGGVGLNLTAADTVILYDPWWNPAVERQAMDRAHRIGQDKPVFVHKMIAEGTVEEAIQQMQAKKQALADALFEGREGVSNVLDETDVAALFAPA
jgi:superfamily II DNA or RNA helicase